MVSNEQRRKQLAREKYVRQQQRREAARRKSQRRLAVISAAIAVVLVAGAVAAAAGAFSGGDDTKDSSAESAPPTPEQSKEPKLTVDKKAAYTMRLETNRGDVSIAMDASKTPRTTNSFKHLADKKFFDGTKCHRLTTEGIRVLQCGDPKGTGEGGPGYNIPDENLKALGKPGKKGTVTYPAGTVAMANTGEPDSGGSQFFLVYEDSELPPSYTPFGKMDDAGLKAVKAVAKAGVSGGGADGAPKKAVTIEKATVEKD
ncbi:peptidylprolyl isomerase [Streptomyces triticagri]|uniref:Peptidylprolyl isomerase n=1 Tax=Streptomyces triticagri TaxID=2293568 RepID=A0A372M8Z8_9ACTN|nr:peptidylprolyl isomerase [Streptomyces triticagri]RFU87414.1 peptidylprolyl isomerase [Streptomyces triticagri]